MDKTILILGASSDIGMSYIEKTKKNATEKMTIVAQYRTQSEQFDKICESTKSVTIIKKQCDLSDGKATDGFVSEMKESNICPTHILHLAAAAFEYMKIKQWDDARVKEEMEISLYSFAKVCNAFLPMMAKNKYGRVVALLSSYTLGTPPKFLANYNTVKSALWGFLKSAAAEFGEKGVTVNGLSPAMMETKFLRAIDEKIVQISAQGAAMKRNARVEETVAAIEYLLSDEASYVNGVNLNMSGGDYM